MCDHAFDSFKPTIYPCDPDRDHMDRGVVSADRERLLAETEKVRLFVEQSFAHRARGTPDTVTWGEFHTALDAMVDVFKKYYALLTQATLTGIEPEPQYDTHECLTFPWWESKRQDSEPDLRYNGRIVPHRFGLPTATVAVEMHMNKLVLSLPTLGFVVGTRAALGVGIGLLLSDKMTESQRRAAGVTLVAIGVATTIPAAMAVFRRQRDSIPAKP